jgi:DNA-binding transcriptional LysR family regulator
VAEPTCIDLFDWDDIRFFTALARHRRLDVAARALGVPRRTVLGRIASLERSLGVELFARSARGFRLNEAGAAALAEAAQMEMAACALSDQVARTNAGVNSPRRRSSRRRPMRGVT